MSKKITDLTSMQVGVCQNSQEKQMSKKIIDLTSYKIEKELRENGFTLKHDGDKRIMLLIKLKNEDTGS
jgi:hypothetical protein